MGNLNLPNNGNPFDQDLNTSSNVEFNNLQATGTLLVSGASTLSGALQVASLKVVGNVGFYNTAPVAQQTHTGVTAGFTAGIGTAVNDDSTFTGNVGSGAYTIGDIVKALKNYGLLVS